MTNGREATALWIDSTVRQRWRLNSGGDWTAKTLSIDALRFCVDKFDRNDGQFYRGGDITATTLSFDAGQDDDE